MKLQRSSCDSSSAAVEDWPRRACAVTRGRAPAHGRGAHFPIFAYLSDCISEGNEVSGRSRCLERSADLKVMSAERFERLERRRDVIETHFCCSLWNRLYTNKKNRIRNAFALKGDKIQSRFFFPGNYHVRSTLWELTKKMNKPRAKSECFQTPRLPASSCLMGMPTDQAPEQTGKRTKERR